MNTLKKLTVYLLTVIILAGTVIALVGLYSKAFGTTAIGLVVILISVLIMELMQRRFRVF